MGWLNILPPHCLLLRIHTKNSLSSYYWPFHWFYYFGYRRKFYEKYASIIFVISLLSLAGLFLFGKPSGQRCWYAIRFYNPTFWICEIGTSLALAKYLSDSQINLKEANRQIQVLAIVFFASPSYPTTTRSWKCVNIQCVFIVLYREGLPAWYIWTGFITIFLFMLSLLEPQYVILIALLAVIIVHFKSRIAQEYCIKRYSVC
jgi:rod shape determining protein RodA